MDMMIAWGVVFGAGLATLLCVFVLTRRIPSQWWRTLVRCLAAVWLLMPAGIQVVPGHYAPAFVVALFESAFRAGGNPRPALLLLAIGSALVLALMLGNLAWRSRRERQSASDRSS